MPKKTGFTLIELLITISIIGILSVIGIVVYTSVLKQGRDSKRQSDLRSIQSALEQYYSDQGFYPQLLGSSPVVSFSSLTSSTGNGQSPLPSPVKTYLNNIPNDSSAPYAYFGYKDTSLNGCNCNNVGTKCNGYCLYAKLENSNPGFGNCFNLTGYGQSWNFALTLP